MFIEGRSIDSEIDLITSRKVAPHHSDDAYTDADDDTDVD